MRTIKITTQASNHSQSKATIYQRKNLNSQEKFLSKDIPKQLPALNRQESYQDLKSIFPKSQNQQTPIQHINEKSLILEQQQFQQGKDMFFSQINSNAKPPRPQRTYNTENNFIKLTLQNSENENQITNIQYNQQNQIKEIVNKLKEQHGNQNIILQYENTILQPELSLQQQIREIRNNITLKYKIDSQELQPPAQLINSNYTVATITKQQRSKVTLQKQLSNAFKIKTEVFPSQQLDFQVPENNFENGDNNYSSLQNFFSGRKRFLQTVIEQSPDNQLRNKQPCEVNQFRVKSSKPDNQQLNNLQQRPRDKRIDLVRHISNPNPGPNVQQPMENIPIIVDSQSINQNQNDIYQNQLYYQEEQKHNNQLQQILVNTTKYLFFKCQTNDCNYFCIVTYFHNQNYYCQNCDKLSVIVDFHLKTLTFQCCHTLNCFDIIRKVQNAIQNEQLARCSDCKQELDYRLIKCFDKSKYYINIKLIIDAQLLKRSILKNTQLRIAECTGSDCNFYTIWDSNKNQIHQGFCISCNQRIAFRMEVKQNFLNKINCGHELSAQKLIGLASDAQIRRDFAKCPQCQVFISLKFFKQFYSQGMQYIDYVFKSQLEILKQQFNDKREVVLSQCSTLGCIFFYAYQNKTICISKEQVVFSQQFNLNNSKIFSFCPLCLKFSNSNEWKSRTRLQKQANIQFKYS